MTFSDALKIIRNYKLLILIAALLAGMFGYAFSLRQINYYQASVTILVGQNQGLAENLNLTTALQQVANSMSKMITTRAVAEKVVGDLNLDKSPDEVMGQISAQPVQQTQLIDVVVTDTDPVEAARIANGVGAAFSELISRTESSRSGLSAQLWQGATIPSVPVTATRTRSAILAMLLGIGAGVVVAFSLYRINNPWRSTEELEETMKLSVLGAIPQMNYESLSEKNTY
ncbi:MAG: YveK family protein [Thermoleophilia bacterium]